MDNLGSTISNGQGMHAAVPSTGSVGSNASNSEHQLEMTQGRKDVNGYHMPPAAAKKAGSPKMEPLDYVTPLDNLKTGINIGFAKAASTALTSDSPLASICRIVLKAMMSGSYLGFSITLTLNALSAGWDKVSAAMLFPTGFVMLILMGNDLATGNFALLPMAYLAERIQPPRTRDSSKDDRYKMNMLMIWVNWIVVYIGNFMGTLLFLFILWGGMTHFGARSEDGYYSFKEKLCSVSASKVVSYMETGGGAGWFGSFFNGILCNWMVTMGVLLAFSSRSTIGKIVAMYIPILIFICSGYEHSIVNLYLLPAGLVYKCGDYSFGEWWVWNQIPVTLGNMFGGIVLTGFVYFTIWAPKLKKN